jgi:flagellar biosynthetic protein FliQ
MQEAEVAAVLRESVMVVLKLGGPPLLASLCVGILVSLIQAVTQINESALAFVPKVIVTGLVLTLTGSFMLASLNDLARDIFDRVVAAGGS